MLKARTPDRMGGGKKGARVCVQRGEREAAGVKGCSAQCIAWGEGERRYRGREQCKVQSKGGGGDGSFGGIV
jgi:hypothetical protein